MPKLLISGRDGEREVEFRDAVTLGSDADCDVVLRGGNVSHQHCSIQPVMGAWKIVDLESDAGTRVNGAYVNQRPIRTGDVLELGDVRLVFQDEIPVAAPLVEPRGVAPIVAPVVAPAAAPLGGSARSAPGRGGSRTPAKRSAPGRGGQSTGRSSDRGGSGSRGRDDGGEERASRRPRRRQSSDVGTKVALIVGVLVLLVGAGYLLVLPGTTPNEQAFLRMRAAEERFDWPAVIRESQGGDLADPDFGRRIADLKGKAERQIVAEQGRAKVAESEKAWNAIIIWRQDDNWKNVDEMVFKIDQFLASYERWGGAPVELARKERAKLTGSSGAGEAADAATAWSRLQSDLGALKSNGQFGAAIAKVVAFRTKWGGQDPVKAQESRVLEQTLLTDAGRWFAVQVSQAHHKAEMGSKFQGRKVLENAAKVIGIPEYEERAAVELARLME